MAKVPFSIGTHLVVKHLGYTHHGIYAGRGRVIHYSGFAHLFKSIPLKLRALSNFLMAKKLLFDVILTPNTRVEP